MKNSLHPAVREKRSLSVLVLGGKDKFDQLALRYEESRKDGHVLLFARCVKSAWEILSSRHVDQIVIEVFMENSNNESPFHFLHLLKDSEYADIPTLLVAAEPSPIGASLSTVLARAARCFGAEFVLVKQFEPESIRSRTDKIPPARA
jgi:hypothetical protein